MYGAGDRSRVHLRGRPANGDRCARPIHPPSSRLRRPMRRGMWCDRQTLGSTRPCSNLPACSAERPRASSRRGRPLPRSRQAPHMSQATRKRAAVRQRDPQPPTSSHPGPRPGPAPTPTGKLIERQAAADLLGVSPRTVDRWIASGALRAHRLGRLVRIALRDLEDFVRDRRIVDR